MSPNICVLSCDSFLAQKLCITLASCNEFFGTLRCCFDANASIPPPVGGDNVACMPVHWDAEDTFAKCCEGMDYVVVCPPWNGFNSEWAHRCAKACKAAGVKDVLVLSWMGAEHSTDLTKCFQMEQVFRNAFPQCCILRMGFLQEWLLFLGDGVKNGKGLCCPFQGNKTFAPVDVTDVCNCVLDCVDKLFLAPNKEHCAFKGCVFQLTGPQLVTGPNVCASIEACCDCKCNFQLCTSEECKAVLTACKPIKGLGVCDEFQARCILDMCATVQKGGLGFVSEDMGEICGSSGNAMDGMFRLHKQCFTN